MDTELFLKDFDVVLDLDDDEVYTPVYYKNEDDWFVIGEGDILNDWMLYVKIAFGTNDKVTKKPIVGNLYTYQWGWSLKAIQKIMTFGAETLDVEWSRQSGKTYLLEHLISFLTVFAPRYKTDLIGEKWTTITCSYKEKSALKNFRGFRPKIKKAVDIYNSIYETPTHKLVYGGYKVKNEKKVIVDSADLLEIDVLQGDTSQGWSQAYALSTNTDQDGFSACIIYVDEAILVDAKEFYRSISPFGIANSACTVITGIASTDSSNLQYAVHYNDATYKSIYTWEDIYRFKSATNIDDAEKFKVSVLSEIQKNGGHNSTEVQTNFYMSWEITDGKFTTREQLRKNKVFQSEIGDININADFIVAGLDLSTVSDYQVMTIAEAYEIKGGINAYTKSETTRGWDYYVKEIVTFNPDRQRMDAEIEADKIAKLLNTYKVDMLMIDASGTQKAQVEIIYKAIKKANVNTMCIPYDFGGYSNKANMMSELEATMFSGRLKLPKEENRKTSNSFSLLYDELLLLKKEKSKSGGRNIQYKAPNGKTDDHVMSLALCSYVLPRIEALIFKKSFIEVGLHRYRARMNKFANNNKVEKIVFPETYMTIL